MGLILLLAAAMMLLSAGVSLMSGFDSGFYPLLLSALLTGALGAFPLIFVSKSEQIKNKEGYVIVVGSWVVACLVGMFPYLLWGGEFSLANAWFESVSGFTTTGSTILTRVEALPRSLLFWRASTHLLGGIGVVMFALVALPTLGRNKATLSSVEISPLARDNYRYRTQKMVQVLLVVYLGMALVETLLLRVAGMSFFDAVTTSFSTVATGGFSPRTESIGYYRSLPVELITMGFMLLSSIHFGLIFATFTLRRNNLFRSEVVRYYVGGLLLASVVIALSIWLAGNYETFWLSLRKASFQVVAFASTTGFATADTNNGTPLSLIILICVGLQCGMAGSTAGGIKADRILLSMKLFRSRILQQQHPAAILRIRMNGLTQEPEVINMAMIFIVFYISFILLGTIALTACGMNFTEASSSALASIGNIGPGFGSVGSLGNYHDLPAMAKVVETLLMLLGRLEIFGFIQLLLIRWWK